MKKFLSLVLALVMTMSLVTISSGAKDFTDDSTITYDEAVAVISAIDVVDGYSDGSFNPTATLTRGAAAKIICNLMLGPTTASALSADAAPFSDVPTSNTFAGYIAYCSQKGIISGYADGTFRPAGTLTGYAFMKMLLGALGYDADIEGYTGANWSVAVAKQAIGIGLDDGNDNFVGINAVTREEAALYAFNTLEADTVRYSNTTTVNVSGATVTVGGSDFSKETTSLDYDNSGDSVQQFCEKYFPKLLKTDGATDGFGRPANTWKYKGDKIGTYAETPDAIYTAEVESGTIYSDLDLTDDYAYTVVVDGIKQTSNTYDSEMNANGTFTVEKGEDDALGGNGTLIEVYKDAQKIIVVKSYVGEVTAVEEATSKKDAYVTITAADSVDPIALDGSSDSDSYEFETEDFDEDDIVVYTYSMVDHEIKSMYIAESVAGEVSSYKASKWVNVDGTQYNYNQTIGTTVSSSNVEGDVTLYLDENGYVIYFEEGDVSTAKYALVLKAGADSTKGGNDKWAKLLYTDGTTETVTTKDIYGNYNGTETVDTALVGMWVTYKTNSSNKVVLSKPSGTNASAGSAVMNGSVKIANGKASATLGGSSVAVNSKTTFVVYNSTADSYKVYTGIKNVPDVDNADAAFNTNYAYLVKDGVATLVYVEAASGQISNANDDTLFIAADTIRLIEDADNSYYELNGVVNGEIVAVDLDASDANTCAIAAMLNAGTNILLNSYSVDDDLYTVDSANLTNSSSDGYYNVNSATKAKDGVIVLGGHSEVLADDVVVYKVSNHKISVSRVSAITTGGSSVYKQISYSLNDDGEVNAIYFEKN